MRIRNERIDYKMFVYKTPNNRIGREKKTVIDVMRCGDPIKVVVVLKTERRGWYSPCLRYHNTNKKYVFIT